MYALTDPTIDGAFNKLFKKGYITDRKDIDIDFPIVLKELQLEENIAWEEPGTSTSGEPDTRFPPGILINDINDIADVHNINANDVLERILSERGLDIKMDRISDTYVYIGIRNRLDYQLLFRPNAWISRIRETRKWISYRNARNILKRYGFTSSRVYPVLLREGGSEEIVFQSKYKSNENTLGLKEKLKEVLLGKLGLWLFSSAYCLVATREKIVSNIDQFLDYLNHRTLKPISVPDARNIYKFVSLLLPRKIILTIGDKKGPKYVVIGSRWKLVAERRDKESRILMEMEQEGLRDCVRFPKYLGSDVWQGVRYFVQEAIEGITIDVEQPGLGLVTEEAISIMKKIHHRTVKKIILSEVTYKEVVGWIFEIARGKHKNIEGLDSLTKTLEVYVKNILWGEELKIARMHGDFKIENVIINPDTRRIEGIIDWEHSRSSGLPSLDVWYLLIYNRHMCEGGNIYETMKTMCLENELSQMERETLRSHCLDMEYNEKTASAMKCIFILHHMVCRMTHDYEKAEIEILIRNILQSMVNYLESISVSESHIPERA